MHCPKKDASYPVIVRFEEWLQSPDGGRSDNKTERKQCTAGKTC